MDSERAWVATRKGLVELRRGSSGSGGGWSIARTSFLGEPVSMLLPPQAGGSGRMFAALNLGHFGVKLHASDDTGASWTEVTTPLFPPQPEGEPVGGVPWKLVQIWSMATADGVLWAGTLPGGLFRSADQGATWQLVESLWNEPGRAEWMGGGFDVPGIHSICPHPTRAGEVLVAVSCGGVWVTRDGGASWVVQSSGLRADFMPPDQAGNPNIQDAHCVSRCDAEPDVLWCQHHNGIWRSTDNAASWQEITTAPLSNFGFPVAAHPTQPGTAWFVPGVADQQRVPIGGALAVNRTLDGGQTFESLREGLPQSGCYDLVHRHGLAVDTNGRHLMMGSTTGNLWSSSDGGERWSLVSANLPPIAAVRFG